MATSRATSLRTLTKLTSTSLSKPQSRSLRMTAHVESSPFLTTQKPSFTKVQAAIDDAASAKDAAPASAPSTRQFNTSRSLKSVGDSSTIDFAFLPDFDPDAEAPVAVARVPLLPQSLYPGATKVGYTKEEDAVAVMRPEISTTSATSTHVAPPSPFADVLDNNAIDFHGVTDKLKEKAAQVVEESSTIKTVFNGMLDDIFGAKGSGKTA